MLDEIIKNRKIPEVWTEDCSWDDRRNEIKELLMREEYGYMPEPPESTEFEISPDNCGKKNFCSGNADFKKIICKVKLYGRKFSFPFYVVLPKGKTNVPFFVHINFRPDFPDMFQPTEEITDNGFAVLAFSYKDVTSDDGNMDNGIAGTIFNGRKREAHDPGKIMMWAWAASRVMDYAETLDCLDMSRAAVVGHSRLGKTALVAGMLDERFKIVFSNNSGCSGAAISRGKRGEDIEFICNTFPFWFCENYSKYAGKETDMPFDQHFLVSSIAPRRVYVASAENDVWADPESEFLSCVLAGKVYEKIGLAGFCADDSFPNAPESFMTGNVGYHVRLGEHYLGREDWKHYFEFMKKA